MTVCALDLSRAFDKVNYFTLFSKLMEKNLPKLLIETISNWYLKCSAVVRWGDTLSQTFMINSGVRQGGILSPILFTFYFNDIIRKLEQHGQGCHIPHRFLGCLLYADDILLIANSVVDKQTCLILLCCT